MPSHFDTIVAPITAPGRGAVAAVRLSGPEAWAIGRHVFPALAEAPEVRRAQYGTFSYGDTGLALPFDRHSYTGEESLELFIHGSPTSVRTLLDACLTAGARHAGPGEFTLRAFLNGRIDLTQAEAVAETVNASTAAQLKAATHQLHGRLAQALESPRLAIEEVIVTLEASLDFSEEIGPVDSVGLSESLTKAAGEIATIQGWRAPTQLIKEGVKVVLLGRPNAGKSSLFNALIGSDRAIVTPVPGTTRDTLEATLEWNGVPVTLIDTAGLRESEELAEQLGIGRTHQAADAAQVALYLFDASCGLTGEDVANLARWPEAIPVATKGDAPHPASPHLTLSSKTGAGLPELIERLTPTLETVELPFLPNARHEAHLLAASESLREAIAWLAAHASPDLILPALYSAAAELRAILGIEASVDVLDAIFSKFCIGK